MSETAGASLLDNHPIYKYLSTVATGAFGVVALCEYKPLGEKVAIKFMRRERISQTPESRRYVQLEVMNHRWLKHPHVIKFRELFLTPQHLCIVMEYANAGTLLSKVQQAGRLAEPLARWFFQQLLMALDYCHSHGAAKPAVFNRDIKPENILLHQVPNIEVPFVKLCDFGYSKNSTVSHPQSTVGTLAYMSPEVVKAQSPQGGHYDGAKADIWSCGVTLYAMLAGKRPFDSLQKLLKAEWTIPPEVASSLSPEALDLLRLMLSADPAKRPGLREILDHPWCRVDFPPGALDMNKTCLAIVDYSDIQSEAEILSIIDQACNFTE